ncbi:unnamed protein product [Fraxinus pennsylvanica]|uniref:Uncharacterized protein n=1 Tax=Fraxinus pennsylvanica TaxID=56036 RepID=A0AAD2DX00_9LAMI|nr:unnamed protein product [Fraxinus pennsylvanica]
MRHLVGESENHAEGSIVRRRNQYRNFDRNMRGIPKSRHVEKDMSYCKKKVHIKADCYALKNRNKVAGATEKGKQPALEYGIRMFDEAIRTLTDVRHVLELKRNLISLSVLDSIGYRYIDKAIGDATVSSSSLTDDEVTKLWHMRLWHMIAIDKKTPEEVWSYKTFCYSDLKIFGCPAYAHVDNGKLEPRDIVIDELAMVCGSSFGNSDKTKEHNYSTQMELKIGSEEQLEIAEQSIAYQSSSRLIDSNILPTLPTPPAPYYSMANERPPWKYGKQIW